MTYQGRVIITGMYEGTPFVGFILSSRSEQDRTLVPDYRKNEVGLDPLPGSALQKLCSEDTRKGNRNLYECLMGFDDQKGRPTLLTFNGKMIRSARRNMTIRRPVQYTPEKALKVALDSTPPDREDDARLGSVTGIYRSGEPYSFIGAYDLGNPIHTCKLDLLDNKAFYVSIGDCRTIFVLDLDTGCSLDQLSQQLFEQILGTPPEYGFGAAVCRIEGSQFNIGIHNPRK